MKSKVTKWGNSLAIRIPKVLADAVELSDGSVVEMRSGKNMITLRTLKNKVSLSELLEQVSPDNLHDESDSGRSRSREIW